MKLRDHASALLLLAIVPCLSQLPALIGWKSCNPYYFLAGITDATMGFGGSCVVDGNVGDTTQALGGLSARLWLSGIVPWWDHYAGAGLPLASTMQPSSFFLPFVLLLDLINGPLYVKLGLQISSGVFTYAFLRETGLKRGAAIAGGMMFSINGSFAYFGDAPIFPIPFLPLLLLGIQRSLRSLREPRSGGPLLVAIAIGYSLLAGFPETALVDGLFGLAWFVLMVFGRDLLRTQRLYLAAKVCGGGIVGLLIASPLLIPFLHELPGSSLGPHAFSRTAISLPTALAGLLFPSVFGAPFQYMDIPAWGGVWGYFGMAIALLAIVSLAGNWRDPRRLLCAGWIVFFVCSLFGVAGFMMLRTTIPLLDQVDFRRYPAASCEFAAILLAALAIDDWQRGRPARPDGRRIALSLLLLSVVATVFVMLGQPRFSVGDVYPLLRLAHVVALSLGVAVAIATAWLLSRPVRRPTLGAMLLVALVDGLVAFVNPLLYGVTPSRPDLAPIAYLRDHIGFSRVHSLGPRLMPNYAGYFGISSIDDQFCPFPLLWAELASHLDPASNGFSLIGALDTNARNLIARRTVFETYAVRYVLLPSAGDPLVNQPGFRRVFEDARSRIYELPAARPYFSVSAGCVLHAADRDYLEADCGAPALLTRREMSFPGWRVRVNGHKAPIVTVEPAFQQIALPAGRSMIVWRYWPVDAGSIAAGLFAGVAALGAMIAVFAWPAQAASLGDKLGRAVRQRRRRLSRTLPARTDR